MKRDMDVWVKVLNKEGHRIGLSMKEIDQATGRNISEFTDVKQRKILKGPEIIQPEFGKITGISTKVE